MVMKDFDPDKFIDRKMETELFEDLLLFNNRARVLAIRDEGGMGKSQLLAKLVSRCRTVKPRTPFCFIDLGDLEDKRSFGFVKKVEENLRIAWGLKFSRFASYYVALQSEDFTVFRSSIYLSDADFSNAQNTRISGTNFEKADNVVVNNASSSPAMSPKQQELAEQVCLGAFFDDLRDICQVAPVVLLLDTYEKCEDKLQTWIEDYLLDKQFFQLETRPTRLLLVVAGRKIPAFEKNWTPEDVTAIVSSVKELGKWEREHIEECLKVNGYNYTDKEVDFFYETVKLGWTPYEIVQAMETTYQRRRR